MGYEKNVKLARRISKWFLRNPHQTPSIPARLRGLVLSELRKQAARLEAARRRQAP